MKQWLSRRIIGLLALLVALAMVNLSVFQKEQQLAHGKVVYLDLAPVDPRSLMQGDYMALSFAIGQEIRRAFGRSAQEFFNGENVNPLRRCYPRQPEQGELQGAVQRTRFGPGVVVVALPDTP
ncbi:MAG: GDYXXLXY domain-containing protein [Marinobacter sp.]|nr:GDYXXLXY domain-containing protein [Marinobacter sp.]